MTMITRYNHPLLRSSFNDHFFRDFFHPRRCVSDNCAKVAADILENDTGFTLQIDMPGVKKEDVNISFEKGVLTVSAERKRVNEENGDRYHYSERVWGDLKRSFTVGDGIDTENISARMEDGVLEIALPKKEKVTPRQIPVAD